MNCYWCNNEQLIWEGDIDVDESMGHLYPEYSVRELHEEHGIGYGYQSCSVVFLARARPIVTRQSTCRKGCEILFEECLEIIDQAPVLCGSEGNTRIDPAFINMQKNRAEIRMKMLAKFNPKKYGDKLGVEAEGNISLTVQTGVPDANAK